MSVPRPLDAATVILVRDSGRGGGPYEIFLVRRRKSQHFMGGASVFPGGRLEAGDCDPGLVPYLAGLAPEAACERLQEPDLDPHTAVGLFVAAIRETFEEAGVLLAYGDSGRVLDLSDAGTAGRFASYRLEIHANRMSLGDLARRENLRYGLDLLVPYAHWITPEIESTRFDTRFFLALHPHGQFPFHDSVETTRSLWVTPSRALALHETGALLLMPPTLKTIHELSRYESTAELIAAAAQKKIRPVLPESFADDNCFGVRLPHDPEYTAAALKQPHRPGEPSRIVMKDGRWVLA